MKIIPENTIRLFDHKVDVHALEVILTALRKHGSVYVGVANTQRLEEVPTLAEVLYK